MGLSAAALVFLAAISPAQRLAFVAAGDAGRPYGLAQDMQAIVYQESSFCVKKVGAHGELGCGQVKPDTALVVNPEVDIERLLRDDAYNLRHTAMVLDRCFHRFRNRARVYVCYNQGMTFALNITNEQAEKHDYAITIFKRRDEFTKHRPAAKVAVPERPGRAVP